MKILPDLKGLSTVANPLLETFVVSASPWLSEIENWDPERWGYTFILSKRDIEHHTKINITPHLSTEEGYHIDLPSYEDWEYASCDEQSGYYHAVTVVGAEYGASIFMSKTFVNAIPELKETLKQLIEKEKNDVE